MLISDILAPSRVACGVKAGSKKRLLELLGELAVRDAPELDNSEVFQSLLSRERLGSTSIGKGVAIPHGRLKHADHAVGAMMRLEQGIDFDGADREPVDLVFALLVPEQSTEEHLQILGMLAELFMDDQLRGRLRSAQSDADLYKLITGGQAAAS